MTTVAIVQARMGSTRLPGKVLADLGGRPMLARVLDRLRRARSLDAVVVATSTLPGDDPVAELCGELGVPVFRGSEEDVLDRYTQAARHFGADVVVRVTADCPFVDPAVVDRVVHTLVETGADYASNALERSFPRGLDVEAFRLNALEQADRDAHEPWERAHVTAYFYGNRQSFSLVGIRHETDESHHRWTVDTVEDLSFARALFRAVERADLLSLAELLEIARNRPDLSKINAHVLQKQLRDG